MFNFAPLEEVQLCPAPLPVNKYPLGHPQAAPSLSDSLSSESHNTLVQPEVLAPSSGHVDDFGTQSPLSIVSPDEHCESVGGFDGHD